MGILKDNVGREIEIRLATDEDLKRVFALVKSRDKEKSGGAPAQHYRGVPVFVAVKNGVVKGMGIAKRSGANGILCGLYVAPAYRRAGIARMLAVSRCALLFDSGCASVHANIAAGNAGSERVYVGLGFRCVGRKSRSATLRRWVATRAEFESATKG